MAIGRLLSNIVNDVKYVANPKNIGGLRIRPAAPASSRLGKVWANMPGARMPGLRVGAWGAGLYGLNEMGQSGYNSYNGILDKVSERIAADSGIPKEDVRDEIAPYVQRSLIDAWSQPVRSMFGQEQTQAEKDQAKVTRGASTDAMVAGLQSASDKRSPLGRLARAAVSPVGALLNEGTFGAADAAEDPREYYQHFIDQTKERYRHLGNPDTQANVGSDLRHAYDSLGQRYGVARQGAVGAAKDLWQDTQDHYQAPLATDTRATLGRLASRHKALGSNQLRQTYDAGVDGAQQLMGQATGKAKQLPSFLKGVFDSVR